MSRFTFRFGPLLLATVILAGCGGGSDDQTSAYSSLTGSSDNQNQPPVYSSLVTFGDSLSDVGTYAVGTIKALGGGKYTINGPDANNWTEILAAQLKVSALCPAQTGLEGRAVAGFSVPVTQHPGCTSYAQGGARVTDPAGLGNKLRGGTNAILGLTTVPVVTQIQNHLALNGDQFRQDQIVFVMAGANDVFTQLDTLSDGVDANMAVSALGSAGSELAGYVRNLIIGKGARYVVVVNLPDISKTPYGQAQDAATQALINAMVTTFNGQLQQGLSGLNIVYVDAYTVTQDQFSNPAAYGLANVTTPACDLSLEKNPLGSSLICTRNNLIPGATDNFLYADTAHPTPYGNVLLARLVSAEMHKKGWL